MTVLYKTQKYAAWAKYHSLRRLQLLYLSDTKWLKEVLSTVVTTLQIDPFGG